MIELTTPTPPRSRPSRPRPHPGRQPGDGDGDDLIIVAPEEDAREAMLAAKRASREHPSRVLGVILGDARGCARQRPGRQR